LKIEEYLETLPENLLSGEDVQLPEKSFREIFKFADLGENDIFYHLGCGNEIGVEIAINEFKVKKAVGIDNNPEKIQHAKEILEQKNIQGQLICKNIEESDIADASVILFWFTDDNVINRMLEKFENLKPETKIITIWGPLPDCLPDKVNFLEVFLNILQFSIVLFLQEGIYSLILSNFETACHNCVLTYEGMLGSCVTSSSKLIVFAALTDSEYSSLFKSLIKSEIDFLIVFGVELFEAIWFNVSIAPFIDSLF